MEPSEEKLITLEPGQTKEIGIVLDDSPRMMMVNTLISKNLPSSINKNFDELEMNEKATPFEGERILEQPIKFAMPNETIVDNEDTGFELLDKPSKNWLKKLLAVEKTEDKYIGMNFWHAPNRWRGTTNDDFYGKLKQETETRKSPGKQKSIRVVVTMFITTPATSVPHGDVDETIEGGMNL
jgi:hypothetical protein